MPDWAAFVVATAALTLLLLYFTRRSRRILASARIVDSRRQVAVDGDTDQDGDVDRDDDTDRDGDADRSSDANRRNRPVLTTRLLLANAAASQAVALTVLVAIAWWTAVPASAFGIGEAHPVFGSNGRPSLGALRLGALRLDAGGPIVVGAGAGVLLAAGNEAAARLGVRVGVVPSTRLREAMAPTGVGEWILLLAVVLPVVAGFEEALFRGALIGALSVGFAVDPWHLVVVSSVAFGLGHGAQGRIGIVVAVALGLALGGLFVATGSLLAVVVAHYVVNAVEFVVHERSRTVSSGSRAGRAE
ncbi:CPBP family intramembrane metalloprotease [Halorubrum sp. CBA1125]|uniref:CPBP family intramembrane glutamic endopeptidase n=1 Tax=Halorubrum sp. CBA1125 TaxID=2668072 RepID=UPI0012E8CBB3|nr:CPBP family intramembrane glutamic endopeptidase [Halorubrum sp. CBA1125]MUW15723.1 CPBP family intramembrane metalloprotease [Halorubrum sp. CBA1125]